VSWRALWVSVVLAFVWTTAALFATRGHVPSGTRIFLADMGDSTYRVVADEARVEGFCTVFYRSGERIAAVCGQHTWSQTQEAQ
jgi:hypothetical protein